MKVRFRFTDNANIHSGKKSGWIDPVELGYDEGDWERLTAAQKEDAAFQWARDNGLEYYYEEKEN